MLVVLHVCDDMVVVAKASGMLVHRGWGDDDDVLVDRVRAQFGASAAPVHRLDRGTSGVIVFARSSEISKRIQASLESGEARKTYVALVRGRAPDEARVDRALPRREDGPRVPAATNVACLETVTLPDSALRESRYSLVVAHPETGRLHQVRRHLKSLGHPVIGDANYGRSEHNQLLAERVGLHRLALHALRLSLKHPRTDAAIEWWAPFPEDLRGPLAALGFDVEVAQARALAIAADQPKSPQDLGSSPGNT